MDDRAFRQNQFYQELDFAVENLYIVYVEEKMHFLPQTISLFVFPSLIVMCHHSIKPLYPDILPRSKLNCPAGSYSATFELTTAR